MKSQSVLTAREKSLGVIRVKGFQAVQAVCFQLAVQERVVELVQEFVACHLTRGQEGVMERW